MATIRTIRTIRTTLKNSTGFTVPHVNRIWRGANKLKTKIVYKITETYAKVTKQIKFGIISIIKQRLHENFFTEMSIL